jgi:hypothetical protein
MPLDPFWQKALATALPPPRQNGTSSFGSHARAKSMLAFACPFGRLKCTLHDDTPALKKRAPCYGARGACQLSETTIE